MQLNQAITVRIMPATDTKPKRWKAKAVAGSIMGSDNSYGWDNYTNEQKALVMAQVYCNHYNWPAPVAGGILFNGDYVFVTGPLTE